MTEKKQGEDVVAAGEEASKVTTGAWWKSALGLLPKRKNEPDLLEKKEEQADRRSGTTVEKSLEPEKAEVKDQPVAEKNEVSHGAERKSRQKGRSRTPRQPKASRQHAEDAQSKSSEEPKKEGTPEQKVVTKLLINAEEPEECRIVLVENGKLESFHVTSVVRERTKNNIYKGKIVSIEANLQAAFVEINGGKNGFLPFNEIHPEYYRDDIDKKSRELVEQQQWNKLKIENVVSRGQEVLVQVVKEPTGNKGANMTTYLSLPGRYLVLMPGSDSAGVSRKIAGEEKRHQLREIMSNFSIPEGIGYIIRTASVDITKTALQKDLRYLLRLWGEIKKRGQEMDAPALIYKDQDIVVRFLRDHFVSEIQEILVDTQDSFDQVQKFVSLMPTKQQKTKIKLHKGKP